MVCSGCLCEVFSGRPLATQCRSNLRRNIAVVCEFRLARCIACLVVIAGDSPAVFLLCVECKERICLSMRHVKYDVIFVIRMVVVYGLLTIRD